MAPAHTAMTDPRADAASLLPRLPEERWDRAHDQADEQPGSDGAGHVDGRGDALGKAQKADGATPARCGRNHRQYLGMASRGWVSTSIKGR